jgi:hypothetical protein
MQPQTKEDIKALIRLLGFLTLVAIFIAFIKHADTLAECVIEEDDGIVTHIGIYGSAQACQELQERIRPWETNNIKIDYNSLEENQ